MASALDRLRELGRQPEWRKVGRFEVNTTTGERRPIPGLELGPEASTFDPGTPWTDNILDPGTAAEQWGALGQGIANLPGYVADGATWAAQNNPWTLTGQAISGPVMDALGVERPSFEEQRKKERAVKDEFLAPYRRAATGIGPEIPAFSDNPIKSTVLGGLQSAPQTALTAVTGPVGAAMSGAQQAEQSYAEMKSRGVPNYIAIPASGLVGTAQGALDKIGADGAFKGATGSLIGRTLKGGAIEGLTESAQEGIGILGESLTGKEQTLRELRDRVSASFAGGLISGGALGAAPRIDGINAQPEVPVPIAQVKSQEIERRVFPDRRVMDYAKMAMSDPRRALGTALVDAGQAVAPDLKREMILDTQTELSLKTEWDKARDRINADPEAAVIRLDLDGVKSANDNLGHDVADQVVFRPMADAVHAIADKYGIGERLRFRAGGDEFVLAVPKDVAPQIVEELKAATTPRFTPVPPDKAALAGMPEGAYVQYGASVGWGMDDHAADQEVYKIKESRPARGTLVGPDAVPQLVSQAEAEGQVLAGVVDRTAPPRSTRFPPRYGVRAERAAGPDGALPLSAMDGPASIVSPPGTDEYLGAIGRKTAPYSRTRDKRFSEAPTGPDWDPGPNWGEILGGEPTPGGIPGLPDVAALRETLFAPGWERMAREAHRQASFVADQAAPGTPIDGMYGIKRNIEVLPSGDPRSVASRTPRQKVVPSPPGMELSPWASPPAVEMLSEEERASQPYPMSKTEEARWYEKEGVARGEWRAKWVPPLEPEALAAYVATIPEGIADANRRGWSGEAMRLEMSLEAIVRNNPGLFTEDQKERLSISTREAMAGAGLLMGVPVEAVNKAVDGAAAFLHGANKIRQKGFTARGNLPEQWMGAIEQSEQTTRAAKLETDYLATDYGRALEKELKSGAAPEEINALAKDYLEGKLDESAVPAGMKPVLDELRTYIDESISQELINSGVARDPAHAAAILANKGKYLLRAFKMHTEAGWADKMRGTEIYEKAVDERIAREDDFFRGVVESRDSLAAEYQGRVEVLAWQQKRALELIAEKEAALAENRGLQKEVVAGQLAQSRGIRDEALSQLSLDRESELAARGSQGDQSFESEDAAYQEDMAVLDEYEQTFGVGAKGLDWARAKLRAEHYEAKREMARAERADYHQLGRNYTEEAWRARAEHRAASAQIRGDAQMQSMALEGEIGNQVAGQMGQVFAESNTPNTAGPLNYGRKDLRSRIAAERDALRQRYAKKLGIAQGRAAWASKKIAEISAKDPAARRAEAAGDVEESITYDPRPISPGGLQGLSRAWLKKRKNITPTMLELMGEYEHPIAGFVIASERAARSISKKKMWDDIILGSEGTETFVGTKRPGFVTKLPVQIFRDGKMQDVYTSKELYEALETAFDTGHQSTGVGAVIDTVNGILKANATVLSIASANRNTLSSLIPLAANGNIIPTMIRHGKGALKVAMANAGWGRKEWRQEAIAMARHGVTGSNVDTRDIERYFKRIAEDPTTRTPLKSAYKFAKDFYAAGDTFAKVVTFKSERDRYAEAYGLPRDSEEVTARAAEVTKRVIQNYDRLPLWAKKVRDAPAIGPFVSFPAAVMINVAGSTRTIAEDIGSSNPKVRQAGIVRAAWFAGTMSGLAFGEQILKSAFKGEEDEERDQQVIDDVRPLLPPWQRNAQMALWDKVPGYLRYVDMTFMNYYGTVTDPVAQLMRGDLAKDGVTQALTDVAWTSAKKIFGEELTLGAYADFTRGPARGGPKVLNDEMSDELAIWRVAKWSMRNIAPGTLRNFYKAVEAYPNNGWKSELGSLSGFKITGVPLGEALDMSLYESASDRDAIKSSLRTAASSTSYLSIPELKANLNGYGGSISSIYGKALDNYRRAVRQGADPEVARASFGEKLDKPGKIMMGLVQSGQTPEEAVARAAAFDWQKQRVAILGRILEKQREALDAYKEKYKDATPMEIEKQRQYLANWAMEAKAAVDAVQIAPPAAIETPEIPAEDPLAKLRALGGAR